MHLDPDWVVCPGETLRELMDDYRLTAHTTAKMLGEEVWRVEGVLSGTEEIDYRFALHLQAAFGVSVEVWLNLERIYREGLAAGKRAM